ncbi:MAG: protein of unassigned function, partial [Myxococcaceae bacterium]|nr:protein of unassigned function [Myxococcaceae bacterium]
VLAALLWFGMVCYERRWAALRVLLFTGVLTLLLGLPHVLDMMARADRGPPLALTIRGFDQWDTRVADPLLRLLGRLVLLPLNYGLELGLFMLGTLLFWTGPAHRQVRTSEVARVLTLYAAAGFFFSTFTRSTVLLNDIAWRAPMAMQLAMLVWTAAALQRMRLASLRTAGLRPRAFALLAAIGWATTAYGALAQRAYVRMPVVPWASYVNAHPETDRALRSAYEWMARELPPRTVTQHNPAPTRVFDFGLYGRNPVAVADRQASLYGASKREVEARVQRLEPVFTQLLSPSEVRRRADACGVEQLIVTEHDLPWQDKSSWVWRTAPSYENSRVRIIATASLPPAGAQPTPAGMARTVLERRP